MKSEKIEIKDSKKSINRKKKEIKNKKECPDNIQFLYDITAEQYNIELKSQNTFCVFTSINDIINLIYSNYGLIVTYDLINRQLLNKVRTLDFEISNFRHYLDKNNKRDLMLSISSTNIIKLWDIKNMECLINIKGIYSCEQNLKSVCLLNDKNQWYILTSSCLNCEDILLFDLKGKQLKQISSNDETYFIDTYYDKNLSKNFILTGNNGYIKSYLYDENCKLYHKYSDNDKKEHYNIIINEIENEIKLIESCWDGYIRIWNFHSQKLLKKIKINDFIILDICLWNDKYIFVGSTDNTIKLIYLENGEIINNLDGYNPDPITIKKIIHPKYGEFLISQGFNDNKINIWLNKNKYKKNIKNKYFDYHFLLIKINI